jgi:hypothetical protein
MNKIASRLAAAFTAGPLELEGLIVRGSRIIGKRPRWLGTLARRIVQAFRTGMRPLRVQVAAFILGDRGFRSAWKAGRIPQILRESALIRPVMAPVPGAPSTWPVPHILTPGDLAAWLGLKVSELDWFADIRSWERCATSGRLRHYHYRWLEKRCGSARLIEAPKPRLKAIQQRILHEILNSIPPHHVVHGYRTGCSIKTFVAPHACRHVILRMDLQNFFPTIPLSRVMATFLTAGYPESVARLLAGLCSNSTPADVWQDAPCYLRGPDRWQLRRLYQQPHLPQGAPTSPALANLIAYRIDCRLSALATLVHVRYTRYADDLAFSGDEQFAHHAQRFGIHVAAIAMEEGFSVHPRKTRIMRRGVRQRLAGVVLNEHPNIPRADYDRLKAILNNCVRLGPEGQNQHGHHDFRAHLAGRVSYVEMINPDRGRRLRDLFRRIQWQD